MKKAQKEINKLYHQNKIDIIDKSNLFSFYQKKKKNGHFFDREADSFFNTKYYNPCIKLFNCIWFVTSEKLEGYKRKYTIRIMLPSGSIENYLEFQQFNTLKQAKKEMFRTIIFLAKNFIYKQGKLYFKLQTPTEAGFCRCTDFIKTNMIKQN